MAAWEEVAVAVHSQYCESFAFAFEAAAAVE
jgi:hypothetical protein